MISERKGTDPHWKHHPPRFYATPNFLKMGIKMPRFVVFWTSSTIKDEKSAAKFHYIKTVSGKFVAQSIAFRVLSIYWKGVPLFPSYLNAKGPTSIGSTSVAHTSPHSVAAMTSLRHYPPSAHQLASSLKLSARCPVSGCWPSCFSFLSLYIMKRPILHDGLHSLAASQIQH